MKSDNHVERRGIILNAFKDYPTKSGKSVAWTEAFAAEPPLQDRLGIRDISSSSKEMKTLYSATVSAIKYQQRNGEPEPQTKGPRKMNAAARARISAAAKRRWAKAKRNGQTTLSTHERREAAPAAVESAPPRATLNHCPHCGGPLAMFQKVLDVISEG